MLSNCKDGRRPYATAAMVRRVWPLCCIERCKTCVTTTDGKGERRFPMGASLCIAGSARRYLLPPARWGYHRQGAAGAHRSPPLCQGSRPLTARGARPRGCAQRLGGHDFRNQQSNSSAIFGHSAKAAAAHTRTQLSGSCSTTLSAGNAARAGGPISPRAYAASRRSTGSLCSRVCAHSVIPFPQVGFLLAHSYCPPRQLLPCRAQSRWFSRRSRLNAALIRLMCVNACGKFPSASPLGPISSA